MLNIPDFLARRQNLLFAHNAQLLGVPCHNDMCYLCLKCISRKEFENHIIIIGILIIIKKNQKHSKSSSLDKNVGCATFGRSMS